MILIKFLEQLNICAGCHGLYLQLFFIIPFKINKTMKKLFFAAMLVILASCNYTQKDEPVSNADSTSSKKTDTTDSVFTKWYYKISIVEVYTGAPAPAIDYSTTFKDAVEIKGTAKEIYNKTRYYEFTDSLYSDFYKKYVKRFTRVSFKVAGK